MSNKTRTLIVSAAAALLMLALCPATSEAQAVLAYYPGTAACGATPVTAYSPVAVNAYVPRYRPLFPGIAWRRWAFWNSAATPVFAASPVSVSAGYGSACSTCYSPAAACATSCTTCYRPQQCCRYVPQTCYRTEYCNVPVTTYRPVTSCDPCTGCTTTCMKPCTTYCRQARRVPYTTYRMVCETRYTPVTSCRPAPCCPTPCCPTSCCPTGACATGGCDSGNCATGNCATGVADEMADGATQRPTLKPTAPVETHYQPVPAATNSIQVNPGVKVEQMRDLDTRPSLESDVPRQDKTAALNQPVQIVRRVSLDTPAKRTVKYVDDSGWRASSR